MNAPITLSICIATRNRGAFIAETLQSVAAQLTDAVEIVIVDGASSDNTENIVLELQGTIPNLRYQKQPVNGGVDRDYDFAVGLATGEYCWLMSDDDLLMPGAITEVLSAIENHFSLIIVNSEVRTFDFSELLDPSRLRFANNRIYEPSEFETLFTETSAYLTYIGAVVIRRNIWLARLRESFFGSYFIHIGVIFQAPLPSDSIVLHEPLISIRFGNAVWRPKEFEIRMIRWTDLIWSLSGISSATKSKCYRKQPWRSIKSLFFYRAKGTYGIMDYSRWLRPRLTSRWDRCKILSIAIFPGALANLFGLIYCRRNYRDSNIHLLDMRSSRFYFKNWFRS
ncbi:glycosyltransferase family 2 protein [Immundisolibacter sp.]|uniref:glycosyltransferase family 2 protein n=1 Tax=Immundisolibacter sp. TaxID=1934948 RepID=UPI0035684E8A